MDFHKLHFVKILCEYGDFTRPAEIGLKDYCFQEAVVPAVGIAVNLLPGLIGQLYIF